VAKLSQSGGLWPELQLFTGVVHLYCRFFVSARPEQKARLRPETLKKELNCFDYGSFIDV